MATTFLEPGGDSTFDLAVTNGFWSQLVIAPSIASDFVHGTHQRSIKFRANNQDIVDAKLGILTDAGGTVSVYLYFTALPTTSMGAFMVIANAGGSSIVRLYLTTAGVLQLWRGAGVAQMGSDGPTLATGQWYRISVAYTIASATVNEFRVFVNGSLSITASNTASLNTGSSYFRTGNIIPNAALDIRASDFYANSSSSLSDPGDIWVTAKRPVSNGTINGFTTQIGSGGSGYGTGHSPQVNERPLSTTNGWSMIGAGSAVTEEYSIEGLSVGDINITGARIIDFEGWLSGSSVTSETASIIVAGATSNIALTSTATVFTAVAGSATYPTGGTDIGIVTSTTLTTVGLYECGIMVAFIPASVSTTNLLSALGVG